MKDLYARAGLRPYESDKDSVRAALSGSTGHFDATRYVLLHEGRRQVYDRTHATLTDIGIVRATFKLNDSAHWREMGDFTRKPPWRNAVANLVRQLIWLVPAGLFITLGLPNLRDGNPPRQLREITAESNTDAWHVTAETLNVRAEPGTRGQVLGQLRKYDTVHVHDQLAEGEWVKVTYNGATAYVASEYLAAGDGRVAELAACRAAGMTRPPSGQILESSGTRGEHLLTINASASGDAIAKLETTGGETVYVVYIRAGESASIETVPDGEFQFKFATGQDYSPFCGRFVNGMQAFADHEPKTFERQYVSDGYYVTTLEYTLYDVVSGNFRPTPIDPSDF